jgi:hypothetical protein
MTESQGWVLIALLAWAAFKIYWRLVSIEEEIVRLCALTNQANDSRETALGNLQNDVNDIKGDIRLPDRMDDRRWTR